MTILSSYLYNDVAQGGTVVVTYPAGFTPDSYDMAGALVCLISIDASLPKNSYSLAWGTSSLTVTNLVGVWKGGVALLLSVPDVQRAGEPVTAIVNPITGRIKKLTVSSRDSMADLGVISVSLRKMASQKPFGSTAISATALVTRHTSYVSPISFVAYKVRLYNANIAAITMSAAVTTQGATGDGVYSAATWEMPTFAGAASVSVPAGSGSTPEFTLGYVDSDVMFTPSVAYVDGTIVALRTYALAGNNTRFDNGSGLTPYGISTGMYCAFLTGVDGTTSPAAFTGQTPHFSMPPIELIAYTDKQVTRIGLFGSSTLAGQGDITSQGWAWRAQQLMSSSAGAYLFANHSQSGRTTAKGLATALQMMPSGVFDYAVLNVFSSNDSDASTQSGLNRLSASMRIFADACAQYGVKPFFATFQAYTGMTGTLNANRKLVNQAARDYAATIGAGVFDIAGLFSDETQSNGTWKNLSFTDDGTHPNATAAPVLAAYAATVFV